MKSTGKVVVLFLLTVFVAGCRHRATVLLPPPPSPSQAAQGPTLPVYLSEAGMSPPQMPPPELPKITPPEARTSEHRTKRSYPIRSRAQHTEVPAEQSPAGENADTAASSTSSDITPIGQLTAAGESTNTERRNRIQDDINATQKGLDMLKQPLSKQEQTTANQIRTFLTKAKLALNQEDLDGARILVTKAKVLLAEIADK
ncbi:MAG TPA: hypothetical protein VMU92_13360 [Acidobacteriaceae bacterium]|nr:hypothetical protein [Acidobacteriaceae bacterium]